MRQDPTAGSRRDRNCARADRGDPGPRRRRSGDRVGGVAARVRAAIRLTAGAATRPSVVLGRQ